MNEDLFLLQIPLDGNIPEEVIECNNCGAYNSKENNFCWACDTKLER